MAKMKSVASPAVATLIGDVVGSRDNPDRRQLHRRVRAALDVIAEPAVDPPAITVGDEFQGTYPSVGQAIDAALTLRLTVAADIDVRFGIGWGPVTVLDAESGVQDGPGWWAARDAIEVTADTQQQHGLTHVRTTFRTGSTRAPTHMPSTPP